MKRLVLEEVGKLTIQQEPQPIPAPEEALLKLRALGICGTDVNSFSGNSSLVRYPLIPGHEAAGEVVSIGENSKGIKAGDRVIVDPYVFCGHCVSCGKGQTNACETLKVLGVQTDGAMREYITHPAELLHKVPGNLPWEHVPLAEPLTISLHTLHRGGVKVGDTVVIYGAGAIGVMAALVAVVYGATPVLLDVVAQRLEKARELGVPHTVNILEQDALAEVSRLTDGKMADVIIEASGSPKAIAQVVHMAGYTGRVVLVGWPKTATELDTALITRKELVVCGSRNSAGEFPEALELISTGKISAADIITKVVSFDELPEAIRAISEHPADYLKVVAVV